MVAKDSAKAKRLIIGISGASGTIYGVRLLQMLRKTEIETHLVMSKSAEMTMAYETDLKPKDASRANVGAYERAIGGNFPKKSVDVLIGGFESAL